MLVGGSVTGSGPRPARGARRVRPAGRGDGVRRGLGRLVEPGVAALDHARRLAVKELRNAWGEPRWLEWLAEGWRLEQAAIARGIAVPAPVPAPDGGLPAATCSRTDGSGTAPVRVHRWVESATVPARAGRPRRSRAGSAARSRALHGLALQPTSPTSTPGASGSRPPTSGPISWPGRVRPGRRGRDDLAAAETVARRASALLVPTTLPTTVLVPRRRRPEEPARRCRRPAAHRLGRRAARRARARPRRTPR